MKILLATWAWRPVGGDWTYIENVKRLYESKGHEVIGFGTKHEDNAPTEHEEFFVTGYDYKELNKKKTIGSSFKALKNSVVSFEALRNLDRLLESHQIDFAHLHIIHHWLTPAIIWKLKKHKVPIIWSLHEYKVICPEGSFVSNGSVCEKCFQHKFYNCALKKCKKQSLLASMLASFDAYFYYFTNTYKKVDYFLCPSHFLLTKFNKFGFNLDKLILTNYCYDIAALDSQALNITTANNAKPPDEDKYILYVGRIERIKGILTLIKAVSGTDVRLKIAGSGPATEEMKGYVRSNNLTNIEFLGFCSKQTVYDLTLRSLFVVCPSEWYENYPFSVIETLLLSKPVVGADIGGIPELVLDGETGFLFESGNEFRLQEQILRLWNDPELCEKLGRQARAYIHDIVNFERHWQTLENIIHKLPIKALN